jgi:hypothetical protein
VPDYFSGFSDDNGDDICGYLLTSVLLNSMGCLNIADLWCPTHIVHVLKELHFCHEGDGSNFSSEMPKDSS